MPCGRRRIGSGTCARTSSDFHHFNSCNRGALRSNLCFVRAPGGPAYATVRSSPCPPIRGGPDVRCSTGLLRDPGLLPAPGRPGAGPPDWTSPVNLFFPSCEETQSALTELMEGSLPLHRRLLLRSHLLVCSTCRAVLRGFRALSGKGRPALAPAQDPPPEALEALRKAADRIRKLGREPGDGL